MSEEGNRSHGSRPSPRVVRLRDGSTVCFRPVEAADLRLLAANFAKLTREDIHQRFFEYRSTFPDELARRAARPDGRRQVALIAVPPFESAPSKDVYGLVQLVDDGEGTDAEYAIAIRHDWQGRGLGWALTEAILEEARRRKVLRIIAYVLPDNERMLRMLREFGFTVGCDPEDARVFLAVRRFDPPHGAG